jgi:uncharacterized damage-inducible protein DinB
MIASHSLPSAIEQNLSVLDQGLTLIAALGEERYARRLPLAYNASIGGHLRHIIDHYQSFFAALETGLLDYEHRERSPGIEHSPEFAGRVLTAMTDRLRSMTGSAMEQTLAYCAETAPGKMRTTSVGRELEFLLSHTVHHYALVAVMCRLQDFDPPPEFGVAPSTLRYQQSLVPCAPQAGA